MLPTLTVYADDGLASELESKLEENVASQLEKLNFSDMEKILSGLGNYETEIFIRTICHSLTALGLCRR